MKKILTHSREKARQETALNAGVPADLHTRLRVLAAQEGVPIKEIVTAALQRFLDRASRADSPAA